MDYTQLITSEHKKPKFIALVNKLTNAMNSNAQLLTNLMNTTFDVDSAQGQQLDYIGQWVGLSRFINPAINSVFFSWDDPNYGWDIGYWQDQYSTNGITSLPDPEYRAILKAKIGMNAWDGDIPDALFLLQSTLPNNGFFIQDNQDMSMTMGVTGTIPPLIQALITRGYFDLRPAGVSISHQTSTTFFGWDTNTGNISGWDTGSWGVTIPLL